LSGSGAPGLKNNQSKFNAFEKGNPWETTTIHWKQSYFINLMLSGVKVQTEFRQQYAHARGGLSDWFQRSFSCTREGGIEKTINRKIKGRVQPACGQAGKLVKLRENFATKCARDGVSRGAPLNASWHY
jgi:hypothetical protein